jgi:hypothetical protein
MTHCSAIMTKVLFTWCVQNLFNVSPGLIGERFNGSFGFYDEEIYTYCKCFVIPVYCLRGGGVTACGLDWPCQIVILIFLAWDERYCFAQSLTARWLLKYLFTYIHILHHMYYIVLYAINRMHSECIRNIPASVYVCA